MSAAAPSPKRLVTLLATDIVGSVGLKRRLGHDQAARLIERHDEATKEVIGRYAGAEVMVDTGDGFIISFPTPEQAVEAALALLVELRDRLGEGSGLEVRAGIHIGEIRWLEAGEGATGKVFGMAVDSACRLMDLAGPNQVLTSRLVQEEASLAAIVPPEGHAVEWALHGRYILRGLGSSRQVYEVGLAGISPLAPPPDSPAGRLERTEISRHRHRWVVVGFVALLAGLVGIGGPLLRGAMDRQRQAEYIVTIGTVVDLLGDGEKKRAAAELLAVAPELRGWEWGHLILGTSVAKECVARQATVALNAGSMLNDASFAPNDSRILATASLSGPPFLALWDVDTGESVHYAAAENPLMWVGVNQRADRVLASTSAGARIGLWDLDTKERVPLAAPPLQSGWASAVASRWQSSGGQPMAGLAGDFVWAVLGNDSLWTWSAADGRLLRRIGRAGSPLTAASFSGDGRWAVLVYREGTVELMDLGAEGPSEGVHRVWEVPWSEGLRVGIDPNGSIVAVYRYRELVASEVVFYSVETGRRLGAHAKPANEVIIDLAFSTTGNRILVTMKDIGAIVLDGQSGKLVRLIEPSGEYIRDAAIAPDGTRVATVSVPREEHLQVGSRISLWDVASGRETLVLRGGKRAPASGDLEGRGSEGLLTDQIISLEFSRDGRRILAASEDGDTLVWSSCLKFID